MWGIVDAVVAGMVVFASAFGGAVLGMWLRARVPGHHVDADSRDTIKLGVGFIATMTALVLGLVTASAKSSYDAVDAAVRHTAIGVLALDRALARYGPETGEIRKNLKHAVGVRIDMIWPPGSSKPADLDPMRSGAGSGTEGLAVAIRGLEPRDDAQRALRSRALDLAETLLEARWLVLAGTETTIPGPFLVILVIWLAITFATFGLLAPDNLTVRAILLACTLSVGSAVFLVMEMDTPFEGVLRVSPDPLRHALGLLDQ